MQNIFFNIDLMLCWSNVQTMALHDMQDLLRVKHQTWVIPLDRVNITTQLPVKFSLYFFRCLEGRNGVWSFSGFAQGDRTLFNRLIKGYGWDFFNRRERCIWIYLSIMFFLNSRRVIAQNVTLWWISSR